LSKLEFISGFPDINDYHLTIR